MFTKMPKRFPSFFFSILLCQCRNEFRAVTIKYIQIVLENRYTSLQVIFDGISMGFEINGKKNVEVDCNTKVAD